MPFEYRIGGEPPVVRVSGAGAITFESWVAVMYAVRADASFVPGLPILVDVRTASRALPRGAAALIAYTCTTLATGQPIAIVAPGQSPSYSVARQVGSLTDGQVRAFTDPNAAEHWVQGTRSRTRHPT